MVKEIIKFATLELNQNSWCLHCQFQSQARDLVVYKKVKVNRQALHKPCMLIKQDIKALRAAVRMVVRLLTASLTVLLLFVAGGRLGLQFSSSRLLGPVSRHGSEPGAEGLLNSVPSGWSVGVFPHYRRRCPETDKMLFVLRFYLHCDRSRAVGLS